MAESEVVPPIHYVDEDGAEPICRSAVQGDWMTYFTGETTCPRCRALLVLADADCQRLNVSLEQALAVIAATEARRG